MTGFTEHNITISLAALALFRDLHPPSDEQTGHAHEYLTIGRPPDAGRRVYVPNLHPGLRLTSGQSPSCTNAGKPLETQSQPLAM